MTNTNIAKVGIMPGRLQEVGFESGTTVEQVLSLAGLTFDGQEIKIDGSVATLETVVPDNASHILLSKKVKGNSGIVKVGIMPGRLQEVGYEEGTTVAQALEYAGLTFDGQEIKIDGNVSALDTVIPANASHILLSKKVKGNADMNTFKIGIMPGRLVEVTVEGDVTVQGALELAGLEFDGQEIKIDGAVSALDALVPNGASHVLLSKKVKGNTDIVKIGIMPGRLQEVGLESGTTVQQALEMAGLEFDGQEIKIDGAVSALDAVIPAGASHVLLSKKVKGNTDIVKIGIMPGRLQEVGYESGTTVGQALELAGLTFDGQEIKIDGTVAQLDSVIPSGASHVLLSKKVKGNDK